jgi:hypothetical protein
MHSFLDFALVVADVVVLSEASITRFHSRKQAHVKKRPCLSFMEVMRGFVRTSSGTRLLGQVDGPRGSGP